MSLWLYIGLALLAAAVAAVVAFTHRRQGTCKRCSAAAGKCAADAECDAKLGGLGGATAATPTLLQTRRPRVAFDVPSAN